MGSVCFNAGLYRGVMHINDSSTIVIQKKVKKFPKSCDECILIFIPGELYVFYSYIIELITQKDYVQNFVLLHQR